MPEFPCASTPSVDIFHLSPEGSHRTDVALRRRAKVVAGLRRVQLPRTRPRINCLRGKTDQRPETGKATARMPHGNVISCVPPSSEGPIIQLCDRGL